MVGLIRVYLKGYTAIGGLRKYLFEIDWTIEKGKFAYQLKNSISLKKHLINRTWCLG